MPRLLPDGLVTTLVLLVLLSADEDDDEDEDDDVDAALATMRGTVNE